MPLQEVALRSTLLGNEMLPWDITEAFSRPVIILVLLFWNHSNTSRSSSAENIRTGAVLQMRTHKSRVEEQSRITFLTCWSHCFWCTLGYSFLSWLCREISFSLWARYKKTPLENWRFLLTVSTVNQRLISISHRPGYSGSVMPSIDVSAQGLYMYPSLVCCHTMLPQDGVQAQGSSHLCGPPWCWQQDASALVFPGYRCTRTPCMSEPYSPLSFYFRSRCWYFQDTEISNQFQCFFITESQNKLSWKGFSRIVKFSS